MTDETKAEMKRYSVSMRAVVTRRVDVDAESQHDAVKRALANYAIPRPPVEVPASTMRPQSVDEIEGRDSETGAVYGERWEVFSACEACDGALFCDDEIVSGSEDDAVYLCAKCAVKCLEEAGADETSALGGEE